MYIILTSKPGEYTTELNVDMEAVESYDYLRFGKKRSSFTIARLLVPTRLRIVDLGPPETVNLVPSKFAKKFESVEAARKELGELVTFGGPDSTLVRTEPVRVGEQT
jgi:hypothetical protein